MVIYYFLIFLLSRFNSVKDKQTKRVEKNKNKENLCRWERNEHKPKFGALFNS